MSKKKAPPITVTHSVLCEDIRMEVGNKVSLIGVFISDVHVAEFPALIRLAAFMELHVNEVGQLPLRFRLIFSEDAEPAIINGTFNAEGLGIGAAPLPAVNIPFKEPGRLLIEHEVMPDKWVEVLSHGIIRTPGSHAT